MSMTIFGQIAAERARQQKLKKDGKLKWTLADQKPTDSSKATVLAKQVGDLATVVASGNTEASGQIRTELVQIAACAVAWVEAIDRAAEATPAQDEIQGA